MSGYIKKKWRGLHADRYDRDPLEKKLALAWQSFNEPTDHLNYLLDIENRGRPPETIGRDRVVANTVIQWLGSPVGSEWIKSVLRES